MTEKEAISRIKYRIKTAIEAAGNGPDGKAYEDLELAIKAFEEIQEYRAIGLTPTMVKNMVESEKQASHAAIFRGAKLDLYEEIGTIEELKTLKEKNEPQNAEFMHNRSDTVSVWKCQCGNVFTTKHEEGILNGTDVKYCCKCGQKFNWTEE